MNLKFKILKVGYVKFLLCLYLAWMPLQLYAAAPAPVIPARAWVLIDQPSNKLLAWGNQDVQLAPASLTKMMTAYLLFADLQNKNLSLEDTLTVPRAALKNEGATIFLTAGEAVNVEVLLQGMLVHSAGDATLTLVETVSDTEADFVARMNAEAHRLGMTRTQFKNATGFDEPGHTSTARDMALLTRALQLQFPQYQHFFVQKEFSHKGITFYNTNRLLWLDSSVDGLKTGRSAKAGYCLAASAKRAEQRRIAIVLGAVSDAKRAQGAQSLLNFGFENFDSARIYRAGQVVKNVKLYRGMRESVNIGFGQDYYLLVAKGAVPRVKAQVVTQQPVVAPIRRGQPLGKLRLILDGNILSEYPLLAMHDVEIAGIFGRGWDSIKLLFAK